MKYIIKDWAGNICFNGKEFESFDDADCFLCETFEELSEAEYEIERGEYVIDEKGNNNE